MKSIIAISVLLLYTTLSVAWADPMSPSTMSGMHQGSSMMNMQEMHNHLRNMEHIMDQVQQAKSDKERLQLMQKHMIEMQSTISVMGPMMNMMGEQKGLLTNEQLMQNQLLMDQRMDMLQQMMQHMVDQQFMFMQQKGMMR